METKSPLRLITMISLIVSLISLIILFLVHSFSRKLQTSTAILQMNCFVAHFLSMLSFLAASFLSFKDIPIWLCKTVAIFAHFSFLAMFGWMNILAWSLFLTIKSLHRQVTCANSHQNNNLVNVDYFGERILCLVLGWVLPLVAVAISFGFDAHAENFMGYGLDRVCWMSWNHRGIIYMFMIPSGFVIVTNTFLVVMSFIFLLRVKVQMNLTIAGRLTVECIFQVVFRASVSMGLEWLLGLVLYILPQSVFLNYAFVFGVGFHGFWLLISTLTLNVFCKPSMSCLKRCFSS